MNQTHSLKGQGALEYLLLIGGAILVAVVVITVLSGIAAPAANPTKEASALAFCKTRPAPLTCTGEVTIDGTTYTCASFSGCAGFGAPSCAGVSCGNTVVGFCESPNACDDSGNCEASPSCGPSDSDSDGVANLADQCDGTPNPTENCATADRCTGQDLESCSTDASGCDSWSLDQTCGAGFTCSASGGGSCNDTTLPTVSLMAPAIGATVYDLVTITANASDNVAVTMVEFYVDSALINTDSAPPGWQTLWNSDLVLDGSHTLEAIAYDAAGNNMTSSPVTVTTDNIVTLAQNCNFPPRNQSCDPSYNVGGLITLSCSTDNICRPSCSPLVNPAIDGCDLTDPCADSQDCDPNVGSGQCVSNSCQ